MNFLSSFLFSLLFVSVIMATTISPIEKYIKLATGIAKAAYLPIPGKRFLQNGKIMENPSTMRPNIFTPYKPSEDKISCSIDGWEAKICESHGTEVILFTHSQQKLKVFGFRGTEPTSIVDWGKNFQMNLAKAIIGSTTFRIHQGFRNRYLNIASWFEAEYQAIPADYTIMITGHSLGGALATIAAAYASGKLNRPPIAVITFGSPLVGQSDFKNYYNKVVGCDRTLRITAKDDWVTVNPSTLLGYTHVCSALEVNGHTSWLAGKLNPIASHDFYGDYDRGLARKYTDVNVINLGCDRVSKNIHH